jgi:ketosteroid isomerase-like protein
MKLTIGTLVLTVCAGAAAAQTTMPRGGARSAPALPMDKMAIEKALIANEQKINDAVLKGDAATFKALVADDALGIDEMGPMPTSEFTKMLKPGLAKITDMKLEDFKVVWADPDTAIVTYTWSGKGTFMDQPVKSPIYVATVYTKRAGKWTAVFHQETPKSTMPAPMKK